MKIKDPQRVVSDIEKQKIVFALRLRGVPIFEIADRLGVSTPTVDRLWNSAFSEFKRKHHNKVEQWIAEQVARYESITQTWFPRAKGYQDEKGVVHQPDAQAASIFRQYSRDHNQLLKVLIPAQLEISGPQGGPIETTQVGPMEAARAISAAFGNNVRRPVAPVIVESIPVLAEDNDDDFDESEPAAAERSSA